MNFSGKEVNDTNQTQQTPVLNRQADFMLKCVMHEIHRCREQFLAGTGLTPVQCIIIEFLGCRPNRCATQKEIEQHLRVRHPTVSGIIKRMEQKGLVRCVPNGEDRRVKDVYLSEKADAYKDRLLASNVTIQQRLTAGMSLADQQELVRLLSIILDNFKE